MIGDIPSCYPISRPQIAYLDDPIAIEEGRCRERISREVITAGPPNDASNQKYQSCRLQKGPSKTSYALTFEDGPYANHFCLSAKRIDDIFYISQYRNFPDSCDEILIDDDDDDDDGDFGISTHEIPTSHVIAIVKRDINHNNVWHVLTTGHDSNQSMNYTKQTGSREIATISHSIKTIPDAKADVRIMKIVIPPLSLYVKSTGKLLVKSNAEEGGKGEEEVCEWCEGLTPDFWGCSVKDAKKAAESFKFESEKEKTKNRRNELRHDDDSMSNAEFYLQTRTPVYNPQICSLVMKFERSRVQKASAKNVLICLSNSSSPNKPLHDCARSVLQFGKISRSSYSMDYKWPLCAVQAFGIALSTFGWDVSK